MVKVDHLIGFILLTLWCSNTGALHAFQKTKTVPVNTVTQHVSDSVVSEPSSWVKDVTKLSLTCSPRQRIALWSVLGVVSASLLIRYRKHCNANLHNLWDWIRRDYPTQQYLDEKLYRAVAKGDLSGVESWWYRGASVNAYLNEGVLQPKKVENNLEEIVESSSRDKDLKNIVESPLHKAVSEGFEKIAHWLISHGADINKKDSRGRTALMRAVQSNKPLTKDIIYLLKQNEEQQQRDAKHQDKAPAGVDISDNSKETALAKSVQHPTEQTKHFIGLLISPENINAQNSALETPLLELLVPQEFTKSNDIDVRTCIGDILLENDADIHVRDAAHETALLRAIRLGYGDLAKNILSRFSATHLSELEEAMFTALQFQRFDMIKMLVDKAVVLKALKTEEAQEFYECKLLVMAVDSGSHETLQQLYDVRKLDARYLEFALWYTLNSNKEITTAQRAAMIQCLVRNGADIRSKNKEGATPLIRAAQRGFTDSAKVFLQTKMADLDIKHNMPVNFLPDHSATQAWRIQLPGISDLLNQADERGYTALHYAAEQGNIALITELKNAGATLSSKNNSEKTPHDLAKEKGYEACLQLLRAPVMGSDWMSFIR